MLANRNIQSKLVSFQENKFLRLFDILLNVLLFKGKYVHIHTFSDQAFRIAELSSLLASLRQKKIIFTLHGGKLNEFESKNQLRVQKTLSRAHKILTPSYFLQKHFEQNGFHVDYLPNPINLVNFPFEHKIRKQSLKILWVRAFDSIYNPELAIQILNELKKVYPEATLTMIGPDKGLLPKCNQMISELGLSNSIHILGPIQNDELYHYYQNHDIYINTTSYESFGLALMEAAACGIPIVSTNVGEIPFIWEHKKSMMIVPLFDPVLFVQAILELDSNETLKNDIIQNARSNAEKYDMKNVIEGWVKLLQA